MSATVLSPGNCAVFISNSGRSSGSPLALLAHAADRGGRPPEDHERYSPMVSRLLQLAVFDILTTAVALRLPAAVRALLQEIKKNLRSRCEPA